MKILHLRKSGGFYGVERMLVELGADSGARAHHVVAAILDDPGASRDFSDRAAARGIETVTFEASGRFSPALVAAIRNYLRREAIDLVHCHGWKADLVGWVARALGVGRRLPLVATIHGWHGAVQGDSKVRASEWLDAQVLRRGFDFVIANSSATYAEAEALGFARERLRVIHYGIAPLDWSPERIGAERAAVREKLGLRDETRLVICVGRLSPEKGHRFAIEAIRDLVRNEGLDVVLLVLGHGPERERLESLAKELGVERRVVLAGFTREVDAHLAAADVFFLPSLQEEFGQVTLEAYRLALPVAATRTWGIPDVVEDGVSGVLFEPGSSRAAADALRGLLADPHRAKALGAAGHARFLERFTSRVMVANHEKLYAELVG